MLARVTGTRNIPKHHLSATSGDAAYKMSEIVPEGMRLEGGRLLSASEDSQVMDAMADKGFVHRYVVGRVPALLTPTEGASDKEKKVRPPVPLVRAALAAHRCLQAKPLSVILPEDAGED